MTTEAQEKKDYIRSIKGYISLIKDDLKSKSVDELQQLHTSLSTLL